MTEPDKIWRDLVQSTELYFNAVREFSRGDVDQLAMVRSGLKGNRTEVLVALSMVPYMDVSERLQVFDRLVFLSLSQKYGNIVRQLIFALPRDWVLEHVEEAAEPFLRDADSVFYRMLLELYLALDAGLAMRLAQRAAASPDVDVAEAGEDYVAMLAILNNNKRFSIK